MEGDLTTADGTAQRRRPQAARLEPGIAAGKTGTTQDYKSSAYLGLHPAVLRRGDHLGLPAPPHRMPRSARTRCRTCHRRCQAQGEASGGMSGGSVPAATWLAAMKPLHEGLPNADFSRADPQYLQGSAAAQVPDRDRPGGRPGQRPDQAPRASRSRWS